MASADNNAPTSSTAPTLCSSGCGFFGNANTGGMCSKCYKETLAKQSPAPAAAASAVTPVVPGEVSAVKPAAPPPVTPPSTVPTPVAASSAPAGAAPADAAPPPAAAVDTAKESQPPGVRNSVPVLVEPDPDDEPPKKKQVNTSRCWTCNKKIGLLGFQCKCDYFFCAEHRYSDKHECSFDFKSQAKKLLTKANPTIAPSKMETF